MAVQIKWRRDTAANWTTNNPVLAQGEPGFETDTGKYKIGDGATAWTTLSHAVFSNENIAALFTDQSGNTISAPASGKALLFAQSIAGRMMLEHFDPAGLVTDIQPFLGRNKVGYWIPPGNATTAPGPFGYTAPTSIGTPTTANVATTNLFTRMRRISYFSATTASAYAGQRVAAAQVCMDSGFYKIVRFGISDAVLASPVNMFVGVSATTSAPSGGTEPSALLNCIGVGHASTDTNLKIFYGGSAAQTPIDLGSSFPINTTSIDAYELALFAPPSEPGVAYYEVTRINSGDVASGVITADAVGIGLPAPLTLLTYAWHWRCNLATAVAVGLDVMSDYIETDN
jgi:hypothetical protein